MHEYQRVDSPAIWPQACVLCASAKGPLVDTFAMKAEERLYLCSLCTKRCARALGLIKGEQMAKLENADALLAEADKTIGELNTIVEKQLADSAAQNRKIQALEELLQLERDNASTRKHWLETINEASRQLVETA